MAHPYYREDKEIALVASYERSFIIDFIFLVPRGLYNFKSLIIHIFNNVTNLNHREKESKMLKKRTISREYAEILIEKETNKFFNDIKETGYSLLPNPVYKKAEEKLYDYIKGLIEGKYIIK